MKKIGYLFILLAVLSLTFSACRKDDDENGNGVTGGETACNKDLTPIVMVHGFLASGDTYANQVMRFSSNLYCENRMFAFDWNTLGQQDNESQLDAFIDDVLSQTGAEKVHLMGHSAGGGLSYDYLSDASRAAKVEKYVHIGSGAQPGPAGPNEDIPTLNIWSPDDLVVSSDDIPGAENVKLFGQDHYEVATSAEAFSAMYEFFNGTSPQTTEIQSSSTVEICGRVLTLGENDPQQNAEVKVYEVKSNTGERVSDSPIATINTNDKGGWGPIAVKRDTNYEFEVDTKVSGDRKVFYYREAFNRSNPLVYLRTFPPPGTLVSFLFNDLPDDANQSVLTVFAANQGVSAGRDVLEVDGHTLSTNDFCDPENNTIALFMYDGNDNQTTDLTPQGLFGQFPFLSSADVYFNATAPNTISCKLNNKSLNVQNKPSSEGVIIAVFD